MWVKIIWKYQKIYVKYCSPYEYYRRGELCNHKFIWNPIIITNPSGKRNRKNIIGVLFNFGDRIRKTKKDKIVIKPYLWRKDKNGRKFVTRQDEGYFHCSSFIIRD